MNARLAKYSQAARFCTQPRTSSIALPQTRLEVKRNCVFVEVLHFVPGPKSKERADAKHPDDYARDQK